MVDYSADSQSTTVVHNRYTQTHGYQHLLQVASYLLRTSGYCIYMGPSQHGRTRTGLSTGLSTGLARGTSAPTLYTHPLAGGPWGGESPPHGATEAHSRHSAGGGALDKATLIACSSRLQKNRARPRWSAAQRLGAALQEALHRCRCTKYYTRDPPSQHVADGWLLAIHGSRARACTDPLRGSFCHLRLRRLRLRRQGEAVAKHDEARCGESCGEERQP